jgi:hypothetical protein
MGQEMNIPHGEASRFGNLASQLCDGWDERMGQGGAAAGAARPMKETSRVARDASRCILDRETVPGGHNFYLKGCPCRSLSPFS